MTTHFVLALALAMFALPASQSAPVKGARLELYSWIEAEKLLQPDTVVVIPLGAALKEHGPHLRLRNDLALADYFTARVEAASAVVLTPPLTYHFYPAFLEYPGSTSLTLETARDYTVQIVRSLARYGPKRFYVLNTGISTTRALEPAAALLAQEGILMHYTDFGAAAGQAAAGVRQQQIGSHADELETSMMLYIDEASVDMRLAAKESAPASTPFRLTRQPGGPGTHSPSGVWGDATLATKEKGRILVEGVVAAVLRDIEALRVARPPTAAVPPASVPPPARAGNFPGVSTERGACLPGVERDIKRVEAAFNLAWLQKDPVAFGDLFSEQGDLVHGDGSIERGRRDITENRGAQFRTREYRDSRLSLAFTIIRCINPSVAVVDARWELRDVVDAAGKPLPRTDGMATLVLQGGGAWPIEAYRYNTKPGAPAGPTLLKKPGYPDK